MSKEYTSAYLTSLRWKIGPSKVQAALSGQWAVGSGQWTVGSGQWAVDSGQWTLAGTLEALEGFAEDLEALEALEALSVLDLQRKVKTYDLIADLTALQLSTSIVTW